MKFPLRKRRRQAAAVPTTKSPRKKRKKHVARVGTGPKSTSSPKRKKRRVAKAVSKLNRQLTKHEEQIKNLKAQKRKFQRKCKKLEEMMEKKGSSDISSIYSSTSTVTSPSQGTSVLDRWSPVVHPAPVVVLEPLEAMQAEQGITAQTPLSKTNQLIRNSGLTPRKVPAVIKKKLIYANVVEDELQTAAKKSDQHKEVVVSLLKGKQLKKYRLKKQLSRQLNVSEKFLRKRKDKSLKCLERRRLLAKQKELERQVRSFLERDDNSRMNPGKQDCLTVDGEKVQTRILNDYLYILYEKFLAENPQVKISKSSFYKLRPKHIRHSNCLKPNNCLCQKHENSTLLLRSLKKVLTEPLPPSPDVFVKSYQTEEAVKGLVDKVTATEVTVQQWQRVLDARDGKRRVKVVSTDMPLSEFKDKFVQDFDKFAEHNARAKTQYTQLRQLKENLPANRIIIQMDFAENFTCASTDAVQSAYWNQATVTLHPCVVYYKEGEQLKHKSYVYVSHLNHHNSSMVIAILKALIKKDLQALISERGIEMVHYITDSPYSQYRNRVMFAAVANHKDLFGIEARWDYFESGHGKGPCDGIGGSVKRMAEQAGKHGTPMADADDFFKWASETGGVVNYTWIGQEEYDLAQKEVNMLQAQIAAVKGTGKLHAVRRGCDAHHVLWRDTSCNCIPECGSECKWEECSLLPPKAKGKLNKFTPCLQCDWLCFCPNGPVLVLVQEESSTTDPTPTTAVDQGATEQDGGGATVQDTSGGGETVHEDGQGATVQDTSGGGETVHEDGQGATVQDTSGGGETVQEDSQGANESQTETPVQLDNSEKESPDMDYIEVVDTDQLQAGVFVITKYDDISYIGKVTDVEEDEIEVTFMTTHGRGQAQKFKWPKHEDKVWVMKYAVLAIVDEPEAARRFFTLNATSLDKFLAIQQTDGK